MTEEHEELRKELRQVDSFDELAKEMASGTISRGQALKMVGATLLGFGSLGILGGVAGAKPKHKAKHKGHKSNGANPPIANGGNSDCAHFCQNLPPGPDRGKCVSDAAHGKGLCFDCGPAGSNAGLCGTVCCPDGKSCDTSTNQCVNKPSLCPAGTPSMTACSSTSGCQCLFLNGDPNGTLVCAAGQEQGGTLCATNGTPLPGVTCPTGQVCAGGGGGNGRCRASCS